MLELLLLLACIALFYTGKWLIKKKHNDEQRKHRTEVFKYKIDRKTYNKIKRSEW